MHYRMTTSARLLSFTSFTAIAASLLVGCVPVVTTNRTNASNTKTTENNQAQENVAMAEIQKPEESQVELATFGGGCFWCVEAVFQQLQGVKSLESGYAGGHVLNPTYEQVCDKNTGHAEVVQIRFDPSQVTYDELLEVFWKTHDPTTPNRQGADVGPQYRSVVYFHNDQQRELAEMYKKKLNETGAFSAPVVTEISPIKNYFPAESYHQDYYRTNPNQGYCRAVIQPKVEKFREVFAEKLKQ